MQRRTISCSFAPSFSSAILTPIKQSNLWCGISGNVYEVVQANKFVVLKWLDMTSGIPRHVIEKM
jgi:hypothetical protein